MARDSRGAAPRDSPPLLWTWRRCSWVSEMSMPRFLRLFNASMSIVETCRDFTGSSVDGSCILGGNGFYPGIFKVAGGWCGGVGSGGLESEHVNICQYDSERVNTTLTCQCDAEHVNTTLNPSKRACKN